MRQQWLTDWLISTNQARIQRAPSAITSFWMVFIFPKLQKIFKEFGQELPWTTRLLADVCDVFADHVWLLPGILMGVLALLSVLLCNRAKAHGQLIGI